MRLNVYLQRAGIGSRREAERMVAEGRVFVNGIVAQPTTPVDDDDKVTWDGKSVAPDLAATPRLFLLHKPIDVLVTNRDHKNRPTVFELPALNAPGLPRLMAVGRLDVNSEGLLVLSTDGPLAQAMMHPDTAMRRIYRVRVRGRFTEQQIANLAKGVVVDGIQYRGAEFVEEAEKGGRTNSWYRVVLTEGKNREIRKLVQHYGGMVNRLIRVQYGPFKLDKIESGALLEVPQKIVSLLVHNLRAQGALK
ncbi:MAG: rRNA pseudouridine synthase [Alphaproteobacteria bacterium]|nr:rRNA pseudouridine synthase [Alphaproteobacteria bacterium]